MGGAGELRTASGFAAARWWNSTRSRSARMRGRGPAFRSELGGHLPGAILRSQESRPDVLCSVPARLLQLRKDQTASLLFVLIATAVTATQEAQVSLPLEPAI